MPTRICDPARTFAMLLALAGAGTATGAGPDAYAPAIAAAHAHLRLNEPAEARRWLARTDESQRGWEWRYVSAQADMSERSATAHEGGAFALAISPDGSMLATGGGAVGAAARRECDREVGRSERGAR